MFLKDEKQIIAALRIAVKHEFAVNVLEKIIVDFQKGKFVVT